MISLRVILVALVLGGCVEDEFVPPPITNNNTNNSTQSRGGFGDPCDDVLLCRAPLICTDGTCAFEGSTVVGEPCQASGECASGLFCDAATSVCTTAGSADVGQECGAEGDCIPGLRCALRGFSGQCVSTGEGDVNSACESSADCLAGLNCAASPSGETICLAGPAGLSLPWAGVDCGEDSGPFRAYFEIPDEEPLADFFRLPYPNDVRLKDGKPDLTGFPTPGDALLGYDLVERYVEAVESTQTGFGLSPAVQLRFSKTANFDTLTASGDTRTVHLIDVDPASPEFGRRRGLRWSANTARNRYVCGNQMMIRPNWGDPLLTNTTYAFIISRGVRSTDGEALQADEDFAAMLGQTRPDGKLGEAWDVHAKLREYLATAEDAPAQEDVLFASVVTTGDPLTPVETLVREARLVVPEVSNATLCGAETTSPCAGEVERECGANDAFHEIHGTLNLPIFQSGTAPYETGGAASSGIKRREDVCIAMTVPKGVAPQAGWPVLLVAHGTGGNFRGHVDDIAPLVTSIDIDGEAVQFVTLGWDQVLHATRRGDSERHPNELIFDYANPEAALGNFMQGAAEIASIVSYVEGLEIPADESPTGELIRLDAQNIWFLGHSQGGTTGPIALPFEDRVKGSIFSGAGAGLSLALMGRTSPINSPAAVSVVLQDSAVSSSHPVINLLQGYFDPIDPHNFARRMTTRPIPARTHRQHVFQTLGIGDTFTPPEALRTMASCLQVLFVEPLVEPIEGAQTAPAPVSGNVQGTTVVGKQYLPDGYDGHFVLFRDASARGDLQEFLGTGVVSGVPEIR